MINRFKHVFQVRATRRVNGKGFDYYYEVNENKLKAWFAYEENRALIIMFTMFLIGMFSGALIMYWWIQGLAKC